MSFLLKGFEAQSFLVAARLLYCRYILTMMQDIVHLKNHSLIFSKTALVEPVPLRIITRLCAADFYAAPLFPAPKYSAE